MIDTAGGRRPLSHKPLSCFAHTLRSAIRSKMPDGWANRPYSVMKHSLIEVQPQTPSHPPQSTFNTDEAEHLTARAERASQDKSNSIETSRLLKNLSRMLYCALVETAQRAKVRLASVIALDRISQRLRRFDQEADVEEMLADTVASVTLMANANDTDDPLEHKRKTTEDLTPAPVAIDQRQQSALVSRVDSDTAVHLQ